MRQKKGYSNPGLKGEKQVSYLICFGILHPKVGSASELVELLKSDKGRPSGLNLRVEEALDATFKIDKRTIFKSVLVVDGKHGSLVYIKYDNGYELSKPVRETSTDVVKIKVYEPGCPGNIEGLETLRARFQGKI